jgi:hypothetical protein
LAFHPYPQLIPQVFNPGGFGPPPRLTVASPWPWVDHSASGPHPATTPPTPEDADSYALFGLAFATATHHRLTSPRSMTRRLILQKARHHHHHTPPKGHAADTALTACRHTVSGTLSLPSRGTFHHSLTVLSAIGHQEVFRLTGWSRQIHSTFHEYAATREHHPQHM